MGNTKSTSDYEPGYTSVLRPIKHNLKKRIFQLERKKYDSFDSWKEQLLICSHSMYHETHHHINNEDRKLDSSSKPDAAKILGQISTRTLQDLVKGDRNRPDIVYLLEQVPVGCNYLSLAPIPFCGRVINVRNCTGFHESKVQLKHHIDIENLQEYDGLLSRKQKQSDDDKLKDRKKIINKNSELFYRLFSVFATFVSSSFFLI
jgi:hypothetical protein